MNHKKLRRRYREERLQVRRRGVRKRAIGTRAPMTIPQGANQRWSLDFASDALSDGRRLRILIVVDDFTRECLALVADTSLGGVRVARELDTIIADRGRPAMCVSDNGTEFTSMAILRWSQERRVEWHYLFNSIGARQPHLILCHQCGKAETDRTADQRRELVAESGQSQRGKNTAQNAEINVEQVLPNLGPSHYET